MRKLAYFLLVLAFVGTTAAGNPAPRPEEVRQVFLIQNSGWMEPFYTDPNSPLRPFMNTLIRRANLRGVEITVASFNQDGQVAGRRSPEVRYEGDYDAARVRDAIQSIDLPRKASGAYADADFRGALLGTFSRILRGQQGLIWLITNNKDAPNNNPEVIANTQAFYGALRQSPYITAIAAFPMRRLVSGPHFTERGLIFYAIAYGERGRAALNAVLRDGAPVRSLFPAPPVRLKPLAVDPVELQLSSQTAGLSAVVTDGRLYISNAPAAGGSLRLQGHLRNRYYPQNIARAQLVARWRAGDPELVGSAVHMAPGQITDVPANGPSGPVTLEMTLPEISRPAGFAGLFADERILRGELEIRLESMEFSLDRDFVSRISAISGGDTIRSEQAEAVMAANLPEVFLDYRRISTATMRVPVEIRVRFSAWPLILLLGAGAFLLIALAALAVVMTRPRSYLIRVGQADQRISIKPRERRVVADAYGNRAEVLGHMFGAPSVRAIESA